MIDSYENVWRHWWAGHMAAVGGESLLEREPIDPGIFWWCEEEPEPEPETAPAEPGIGVWVPPKYRPKSPNGAKSPNGEDTDAPAARPDESRAKRTRTLRPLSAIRKKRSVPKVLAPPVHGEDNSFYDLGDVLERLDDYWIWLKRLKRWYPVGYQLGTTIGAIISPETGRISIAKTKQAPEDPQKWPGFMMTAWPAKYDSEDRIHARLITFYKAGLIGDAVTRGVVFYECLMFFTATKADLLKAEQHLNRKKRRGWEAPVRFAIGVGHDGDILPLRMSLSRFQSDIQVHHHVVDYPLWLKYLTEDNKKYGCTSVQEYARRIFYSTLSETYSAEKGFHVTVKKDDLTARFSVAHQATSRFFRDRDYTATVDGRRARIYHLRPAHQRTLKSGRVIQIPEHYAGAQSFSWYGYQVKITVAGHQHHKATDFNLPMTDAEWVKKDSVEHIDGEKILTSLGKGAWESPKISIHQGRAARDFEVRRLRHDVDHARAEERGLAKSTES